MYFVRNRMISCTVQLVVYNFCQVLLLFLECSDARKRTYNYDEKVLQIEVEFTSEGESISL